MSWEASFAVWGLLLIPGVLIVFLIVIMSYRHAKEKDNVKLICASCGDNSCFIATQNLLQHFSVKTLCESGVINPSLPIKGSTEFEDWIIGDQDRYCYCQKCGYYEKLE